MGDDFFLGRKASSASSSFLAAPRASKSGQPQEAVAGSSEDEARLGLGNDEATPSPPRKRKGTGVEAKTSTSAAVAAALVVGLEGSEGEMAGRKGKGYLKKELPEPNPQLCATTQIVLDLFSASA
jgi:hypothetical protein